MCPVFSFVLLFMSICFSLPQSNFLNGVGSEYEAPVNFIIAHKQDWRFSPLSRYWQWSAGKIAGSANNIVTKPRGGSQWCSRTPDKDLAASRLQLQSRAGDTPSPSNISSREALSYCMPRTPSTCYYCLQEPKQCLSRLLLSSSLYEFKVCVKPHKGWETLLFIEESCLRTFRLDQQILLVCTHHNIFNESVNSVHKTIVNYSANDLKIMRQVWVQVRRLKDAVVMVNSREDQWKKETKVHFSPFKHFGSAHAEWTTFRCALASVTFESLRY